MKRAITLLLAAVGAAAILMSAWWAWQRRPWRMAVEANGRAMTARELAVRGEMLLDDAKRTEHLMVPKGREDEARRHYERTAAKYWIFKEVLLAAARERKVEVTPEDEKKELEKTNSRLAAKKTTLDAFFKSGPLPEGVKRRDFAESMLVAKFLETDVRARVKQPTPMEIEARLAELKHLQFANAKPGVQPKFKANRKAAVDSLRMESYDAALYDLFREHFPKSAVKCPAFPDLEIFDNVAPKSPVRQSKESAK